MPLYLRWTPATLALGALMVAGCETAVVEPAVEIEEYDLLWDLQFGDEMERNAQQQQVSILVRLYRNALQHIAGEEGRETAEAIVERIAAIRAEAREAYNAGDMERARAKVVQARRAMAAVVIRAFGTEPVDRLRTAVGERQTWIAEAIAKREGDGHDPVVLKRFLDHLTTLTDAADRAMEAGRPAIALDYLSRAAEALVRFGQRNAQG
jgi:hypothetical protein